MIKILFIIMKYKNYEDDQNENRIERKQQLSNVLIELIKLGFGTRKGLLKIRILAWLKI